MTKQAYTIEELAVIRAAGGSLPAQNKAGERLVYLMEDGGKLCAECANRSNGSIAELATIADPAEARSDHGSEVAQWLIIGAQVAEAGDECDHCHKAVCWRVLTPALPHRRAWWGNTGAKSGRD